MLMMVVVAVVVVVVVGGGGGADNFSLPQTHSGPRSRNHSIHIHAH
jgi:hypothetical protein